MQILDSILVFIQVFTPPRLPGNGDVQPRRGFYNRNP
jgi:hypothetical protein